jgi:hypothetical protein
MSPMGAAPRMIEGDDKSAKGWRGARTPTSLAAVVADVAPPAPVLAMRSVRCSSSCGNSRAPCARRSDPAVIITTRHTL